MDKFPEFPLFDDVNPIPGDDLCYEVRSQTRREIWHRVELEGYGFNGECGCENFGFHHRPKLLQSIRDKTPTKSRCYHINRALKFHAELSIRVIARKRDRLEQQAKQNENEHNRETHQDRVGGDPDSGLRDQPKRSVRDYQLRESTSFRHAAPKS